MRLLPARQLQIKHCQMRNIWIRLKTTKKKNTPATYCFGSAILKTACSDLVGCFLSAKLQAWLWFPMVLAFSALLFCFLLYYFSHPTVRVSITNISVGLQLSFSAICRPSFLPSMFTESTAGSVEGKLIGYLLQDNETCLCDSVLCCNGIALFIIHLFSKAGFPDSICLTHLRSISSETRL